MMTETVDQSFQKLPRDPKGLYGGMSPLPYERREDQDTQSKNEMESAVNVSSAYGKSKGNLVANSQSNFSDMMEKKQLIVKPPSGNSGDRNRD